jgi:hypothetical protein
MLFLMTLVTEQFKVAPVKGDARVVDIRGRDVLLVVDDVTCTTAAFTDTMLREEVTVAALAPCFALVEPCCKLFDETTRFLDAKRTPAISSRCPFKTVLLYQIFFISSSPKTTPRLLPQSQFT